MTYTNTSLRLSPEAYKNLKAISAATGLSHNSIINVLVEGTANPFHQPVLTILNATVTYNEQP